MIHVVMLLIGLSLFFATRNLYSKNIELFLCLLIPINFNFFHIIPRVGEFDNFREVLLVIIFLHLIERYFLIPFVIGGSSQLNLIHSLRWRKYATFVVFYLFLSGVGVFVAMSYGQPIFMGMLAFKWKMLLLSFFLVVGRNVDVQKFIEYFLVLCVGLALLLFIQYVTIDYLSIFYSYEDSPFHMRLSDFRGVRLLEGIDLIGIGCILSFALYVKTHNVKYLIIFVVLLANHFVVSQSRAYLMAIVITSVILYLYFNRSANKKLLFIFSILFFLPMMTLALSSTSTMSDVPILNSISSDYSGVGKGEGNIDVRLLAYQYYFEKGKDNLWLGRGLLNANWDGNPDGDVMENLHFFFTDIGLMHVFVTYGLFGIVLLVALFINIMKDLFTKEKLIIAPYFFMGLLLSPQIDIFFTDYQLFFAGIFLAMLQNSILQGGEG